MLIRLLATAVVALCTITASAQPVSTRPKPCVAIPDDATPDVVVCVTLACHDYVTAWHNCNGDPDCQDQAWVRYSAEIVGCGLHQSTHFGFINRYAGGWVTLIDTGGRVAIAFAD